MVRLTVLLVGATGRTGGSIADALLGDPSFVSVQSTYTKVSIPLTINLGSASCSSY